MRSCGPVTQHDPVSPLPYNSTQGDSNSTTTGWLPSGTVHPSGELTHPARGTRPLGPFLNLLPVFHLPVNGGRHTGKESRGTRRTGEPSGVPYTRGFRLHSRRSPTGTQRRVLPPDCRPPKPTVGPGIGAGVGG